MTSQHLDRVLTAYRIGDPAGAYPIFSAVGSTVAPGRWNSASSPVIYTSEHYSTAMLEKLAHAGGGGLPPNQHYVQITIPNGISYEVLNPAHLPNWADAAASESRAHGEQWQKSRRSLVLIVPSVVARVDNNVLINPDHPEFSQITHSLHQPVWWDARLFGPSP